MSKLLACLPLMPMRCAITALLLVSCLPARVNAGTPRATATILAGPAAISHAFVPREALGAAIDGHDAGETARIFTPQNLDSMRAAGLGALAYRLRTELANEAWHWNPAGRWSDSTRSRGYWTSSATLARPIDVSFGYRLPRRGNTRDQGNNDGYSRLDDGDTLSFWKSNPYLDPRFTGEPELDHPQWVVADLGRLHRLDGARILWGQPYARRFRIQYWHAEDDQPGDVRPDGRWRDFPAAVWRQGRPGTQDLVLANAPVETRYVRLLLDGSSHTVPAGSRDSRDSLGFAIREIHCGLRQANGSLADVLRHGRSADRQSRMLVSSTDPWHRASDRDRSIEQPGIDLVLRGPLTADQPVMLPVGVLYDTPGNAAALVRYVHARGYPTRRLELGEEPDGQYVAPEDFAALYAQTAHAIRQVDSTAMLGGPSLQDAENGELGYWPERAEARHDWMGRFLGALERAHHRHDFQFFSFEWYPFFHPCEHTAEQVERAPQLLRNAIAQLERHGVPRSLPWLISEYGYSVHAAPAEVGLEGALVNADLVGGFLTAGCGPLFLYGYEPGELMREPDCSGQGNLMLLLADAAGQARDPMPTFYAAWLLTHAWTSEPDRVHRVSPVRVIAEHAADSLAAPNVYAVLRPDGRWGVLLINRDPRRRWDVRVVVAHRDGAAAPLASPAEQWQYSPEQYQWAQPGITTRPERDQPPRHSDTNGSQPMKLPPYSITVVVAGEASGGSEAPNH